MSSSKENLIRIQQIVSQIQTIEQSMEKNVSNGRNNHNSSKPSLLNIESAINSSFGINEIDSPAIEEFLQLYLFTLNDSQKEMDRVEKSAVLFCENYLQLLNPLTISLQNAISSYRSPTASLSNENETNVSNVSNVSSPQLSKKSVSIDPFQSFEDPKSKRTKKLSKSSSSPLIEWFESHLHHPYPTDEEKENLARASGLRIEQLNNWFVNARRRRLPPEMKDKLKLIPSAGVVPFELKQRKKRNNNNNTNNNINNFSQSPFTPDSSSSGGIPQSYAATLNSTPTTTPINSITTSIPTNSIPTSNSIPTTSIPTASIPPNSISGDQRHQTQSTTPQPFISNQNSFNSNFLSQTPALFSASPIPMNNSHLHSSFLLSPSLNNSNFLSQSPTPLNHQSPAFLQNQFSSPALFSGPSPALFSGPSPALFSGPSPQLSLIQPSPTFTQQQQQANQSLHSTSFFSDQH